MARNKRPATAGDMVRTLAVIVIPLVLITVFFSRNLRDYPVQTVDYKPVLTQARREAPYPVLAPDGLPSTWRPTQVTWVPKGAPYLNDQASVRNLWELGYLDPHGVFISVNQGDDQPEQFVSELTRDGLAEGASTVKGQTWVRYVSPDGRTHGLVLASPKVTTIVVGDTTYEALEEFAGALESG